MDALLDLSGVSKTRARQQALGLSESETKQLSRRVIAARNTTRMSVNEFLAMDRASLRSFCARFNFTRAEVRLVQSLAQTIRAMLHTQAIGAYIARARRSGTAQRSILQ